MRNTIQKMVILAKAEPKQSITLGVVTILALGFWARTTVKQGADAHASSGNTTSTAEVRENNTADEQRERIVIASADTTSRDLFLPRPEDFPPPVQPEPSHDETSKSATGSDDKTSETKALTVVTRRQRVLEEARELTLRSTVVGAEPIAVLESRLSGSPERVVLRAGESAFGFTLLRVTNRKAALEKDGVEVELTIPAG